MNRETQVNEPITLDDPAMMEIRQWFAQLDLKSKTDKAIRNWNSRKSGND